MRDETRRFFLLGALSSGGVLLSACSPPSGSEPRLVSSRGAEAIDARVDKALDYLFTKFPNTTRLRDRAAGMLVMPLITEAGFMFGGSFGRGALRVGNLSEAYYSASSASFGLQVGAQQFSHVLFFMTPEALDTFRKADSITLGGDMEFALGDAGGSFSADTGVVGSPVVAIAFGQAGLLGGVSLKGTAYTRIEP